jgi:hypothetical protein
MAERFWEVQRQAAVAIFSRLTARQADALLDVMEALAAARPGADGPGPAHSTVEVGS